MAMQKSCDLIGAILYETLVQYNKSADPLLPCKGLAVQNYYVASSLLQEELCFYTGPEVYR